MRKRHAVEGWGDLPHRAGAKAICWYCHLETELGDPQDQSGYPHMPAVSVLRLLVAEILVRLDSRVLTMSFLKANTHILPMLRVGLTLKALGPPTADKWTQSLPLWRVRTAGGGRTVGCGSSVGWILPRLPGEAGPFSPLLPPFTVMCTVISFWRAWQRQFDNIQ